MIATTGPGSRPARPKSTSPVTPGLKALDLGRGRHPRLTETRRRRHDMPPRGARWWSSLIRRPPQRKLLGSQVSVEDLESASADAAIFFAGDYRSPALPVVTD